MLKSFIVDTGLQSGGKWKIPASVKGKKDILLQTTGMCYTSKDLVGTGDGH